MPGDRRGQGRRRACGSSDSSASRKKKSRRRQARSPSRSRSTRAKKKGNARKKRGGSSSSLSKRRSVSRSRKSKSRSRRRASGALERKGSGGFDKMDGGAPVSGAGRNREHWAAIFAGQNLAAPTAAAAAAAAVKAPRPASGIDFAQVRQLKQQIEEDKKKMLEDMVKVRRDHAEHAATSETSVERQKEYFSAPLGTPCGPDGRFVVQEELGRGMFSSVYRCKDAQQGKAEYAVKFTRRNKTLRKATEREVELLGRLCTATSEKDPEGSMHILGLVFFEGFEHDGHLAVVLELMKCDLRTAIKKYGQGRGLPLLPTVRDFSRQLLLALRALKRVEIIHCDVKPENLLLSNDKETLKLSDFGSAMAMDERIRTDYMQPRNYRAPEVILGQSYSTQIDMWSAGVSIYEMATDKVLFEGKSNNDMLHSMMRVLGAFPKSFAAAGEFRTKHFKEDGKNFLHGAADFGTSSGVLSPSAFAGPPRPLSAVLKETLAQPPRGVPEDRHKGMLRLLEDLLHSGCLRPVPGQRFGPEQALSHRFFQKGAA